MLRPKGSGGRWECLPPGEACSFDGDDLCVDNSGSPALNYARSCLPQSPLDYDYGYKDCYYHTVCMNVIL